MSYWERPWLRKFYGIFTITLLYFIPLTVMAIAYSGMFLVITRRKSDPTSRNQPDDRDTRVKKNIIKTLAIVSLAFIVCLSPNQIYYFLSNIGVDVASYTTMALDITVYMMFSNCVVNPFVYVLQYREFREHGKTLFCKKMLRKKSKRSENNASDTGTEISPVTTDKRSHLQ